MSNATKPVASFREFWVDPEEHSYHTDDDGNEVHCGNCYNFDMPDTTHVIEYEAVEALQSQLESQNSKLSCQVKNVQELHFENIELTQRNQELAKALDLVFYALNYGLTLTEPEKIYDLLDRQIISDTQEEK